MIASVHPCIHWGQGTTVHCTMNEKAVHFSMTFIDSAGAVVYTCVGVTYADVPSPQPFEEACFGLSCLRRQSSLPLSHGIQLLFYPFYFARTSRQRIYCEEISYSRAGAEFLQIRKWREIFTDQAAFFRVAG